MSRSFNPLLLLLTILSVGTTIFVLIDNKNIEVKSEDVHKSIPSSEVEKSDKDLGLEQIEEKSDVGISQDDSANPFDEGLESPKAEKFIKGLLQDAFVSMSNSSPQSDHVLYMPFEDKILNIAEGVSLNSIEASPVEERKIILERSRHFTLDEALKVTDNFELFQCKKSLTSESDPLYKCRFVLRTLDGTGLISEQRVNRLPLNFDFSFVFKNGAYIPTNFSVR